MPRKQKPVLIAISIDEIKQYGIRAVLANHRIFDLSKYTVNEDLEKKIIWLEKK